MVPEVERTHPRTGHSGILGKREGRRGLAEFAKALAGFSIDRFVIEVVVCSGSVCVTKRCIG